MLGVPPCPPTMCMKRLHDTAMFAGIDTPMHVRAARRKRRKPRPPSWGGEAFLPCHVLSLGATAVKA
jgi:hypothetical protein